MTGDELPREFGEIVTFSRRLVRPWKLALLLSNSILCAVLTAVLLRQHQNR
jgi:hypothetical protein